jgi:GNAT superfamily N-acetyltransferase
VVRPATEADAAQLADVHVRSWQWAYQGLMPDHVLAGLDLGAFCVVGPVRAPAPTTRNQADVGEMYGLYADPRVLGTGAGRAVHDAGVAHRWAAGDHHLVLWVLTGNNCARSFYARNGWACDQLVEHHVHAGQSMQVVRYSLARPSQPP